MSETLAPGMRASLASASATIRCKSAIRGLRRATRWRCACTARPRRPCRISRSLSEMDARARRAQLDRRERGGRSRLSLVLRVENVRHLRRSHERPRGPGVLGGGRADHDDRASAQLAGHSRSGGRPRALRPEGRGTRAVDRAARVLFRLSRAAQPQADEARLEGARLHRVPVLLLGLPGDRPRRSHGFRGSRPARPARPDRARSSQRCRQSRPLADAHRHFQLRVLLQVRGGVSGGHPDREPGDRAAEGQSRRARARDGEAFQRAARDRGRARLRRSECARAARARAQVAAPSAARVPASAARQDQSGQDAPEAEDAGERRCRAAP